MKVITFVVQIRVENFDDDILQAKARLMNISGSVSVKHEPLLNVDWEDRKPPEKFNKLLTS